MYEGYNPGDEFSGDDDDEFDSVLDSTVPSARIPISFMGAPLELTPANAAVRLFLGEAVSEYSRVIIYLDDGSTAPLKPEDDFLKTMVRSGFPVELPAKPDETDREFMDGYMRVWTEDASTELDLDS